MIIKQKFLPSNKGDFKILGVRHLLDNVSEWTSSSSGNNNSNLKVVKGGSWSDKQGIYDKKLYTENTTKNDIGFRIVRPFSF